MEKNKIEQMFGEWVEVSNIGGDEAASGYASHMTENAVVLPPNESRVDGRDGVRELIKQFTHADEFKVTFAPTNIDILSDGATAHAIGTYDLSLKDETGNVISDRGKFFDVLEKQEDGSWKCSVAMWNSDIAAE